MTNFRDATVLFFDLDGTLTDSQEGITKSMQYALREMGALVPSHQELIHEIGLPLRHYFEKRLGSDAVEEALRLYRHRYITLEAGTRENGVYPGITTLLKALVAHKKQLFVVTAKPEAVAQNIVRHLGLAVYFKGVYGPALDEVGSDKGKLIERILVAQSISAEATLMIGDREQDVRAAHWNNIRSIGVMWGYGSKRELEEANADLIVDDVVELADILI